MCWFANAKGIGTQTPMQYAPNSTTGVSLGWISLFSFRICSIEFNSRPRACHDLLSILFWLLKNGHERCHVGMCTWADVLNDDRYKYDVMIDLIAYHDAWSVPRVSFHDRCINIAFTTPSSDLRWKCNIDFPLRRYYFPLQTCLQMNSKDVQSDWAMISNVVGDQSTSDSVITNKSLVVANCLSYCFRDSSESITDEGYTYPDVVL